MQNIEIIADELFSKIRGRFPGVTIGDAEGNVTSEPKQARFFEFPFREAKADVGKVSISLSEEDGVVVMHNKDVAENNVSKSTWYDFLKELRQFSKKRLLNFTTRDITKSNLEKRDYKYLAQRSGDSNMTESKLYGTSRISYQDVGEARLIIKHNESIDQTSPTGRNRSIGKIYVESPQGERFMYPFKHLSGARAMARHVAEGGNAYDEFGKHITSLSEELAKLRKFKNYMGRSSVMAESLSEYMDVVKERVVTVKKTIESLQKPKFYAEAFEAFAPVVMEDVPADVAENWIDQLTIRQFNEELSDVFPYIYKLVSEASKAEDINPDDLNEFLPAVAGIAGRAVAGAVANKAVDKLTANKKNKKSKIKDKRLSKEEMEIESAFEEMMGQFAEVNTNEAQDGQVGTMALFVSDQDGGEHEVEVQVKIVNGKPEIDPNTLPGPEDMLYWDDADIEQQAMDAMRDGDIEFDESFDPQSEPSQADLAMEEFMDTYEKGGEKALAAALRISEEELDQDINEWCAEHGKHADDDRDEAIEGVVQELVDDTNFDEGLTDDTNEGIDKDALQAWYSKYEGKRSYDAYDLANGYFKYYLDSGIPTDAMEKGECAALIKKFGEDEFMDDPFGAMYKAPELAPISNALHSEFAKVVGKQAPDEEDVEKAADMIDNTDEGNAFAQKVRQAKANGKKKGDKVDGPDGDEITLEKDEKTPLGEFILSYFDRDNGSFPKGETAVLTMIEKDYGEEYITPAKQFIERINQTFDEHQMRVQPQQMENPEFERIRELAGLR